MIRFHGAAVQSPPIDMIKVLVPTIVECEESVTAKRRHHHLYFRLSLLSEHCCIFRVSNRYAVQLLLETTIKRHEDSVAGLLLWFDLQHGQNCTPGSSCRLPSCQVSSAIFQSLRPIATETVASEDQKSSSGLIRRARNGVNRITGIYCRSWLSQMVPILW